MDFREMVGQQLVALIVRLVTSLGLGQFAKTIAEVASTRAKSPPARPTFPWGKYPLCAALTSGSPLLFWMMSLSGSSGDIGRWHDIAEFLLVSSFLLMLIFGGSTL